MNLYLMGYRGSGKSTVAPLLAIKLDRPYIDLDHEIETQTGLSIQTIFDQEGEPRFRQYETELLCTYPQEAGYVISLGGGAPLAPTNRKWMKQHGKTVWLTAPPEILWERLRHDTAPSQRPALTPLDGLAEVTYLLAKRASIYEECSDYTIDVSSLRPEQLATQISNWWQSVDETKGNNTEEEPTPPTP